MEQIIKENKMSIERIWNESLSVIGFIKRCESWGISNEDAKKYANLQLNKSKQ